ncbi:MAG: RES family NAD+ phosphorylase [Ferruginibacter sp.]
MIVSRITNSQFKDDLSGNGAKLFGGRWNVQGLPALYTSEHISLCVLEMLVNISLPESRLNYHLIQLQVPDNAPLAIITSKKLKTNWQNDAAYTQFMGAEFLKNKQSLILQIPSAVISEEHNYLLNPLHAQFNKVSIVKSFPFKFDKRLFNF